MSMFTETADSLTRAATVSPSDTVGISFSGANPPSYARRLWVGEAGTVKLLTLGGDTVTYTLTAAGYIRVKCIQVFATGTTNSIPIVAEY